MTTAALAQPVPTATDEDDGEQDRLDAEATCLAKLAEAAPGEDRQALLGRRAFLMAEACGEHPLTSQRYYSAADFLGWIERANSLGCATPQTGPAVVERLARHELIPNAPLRERYEALAATGKVTLYDLALALGFTKDDRSKGRMGDTSRVERILGMRPHPMGGGVQSLRLFVTYEQAVALANVLGIDYHDLGV